MANVNNVVEVMEVREHKDNIHFTKISLLQNGTIKTEILNRYEDYIVEDHYLYPELSS